MFCLTYRPYSNPMNIKGIINPFQQALMANNASFVKLTALSLHTESLKNEFF